MWLVERYISRSILSAIGLVVLVLLGLYSFILFIEELNDLGRGHYTALIALGVVFLKLPSQLYQFFPIASLLGCLIGLGTLATHRELLTIQAAGLSILKISYIVLKTACILLLIVTVLGEYYAPKALSLAKDVKLKAITGGNAARISHGVWLRYQNDFLRIGQVRHLQTLYDVMQVHFSRSNQWVFARHINRLEKIQGIWYATDLRETRGSNQKVTVHHERYTRWDIPLDERVLAIVNNETEGLSLLDLYQQIQWAKRLHQATEGLRVIFWKKIAQPLNTLLMILLAIPFIFGPLRQSTMGSKILIGTCVGFSFHLINHFFSSMVNVLNWSPEGVAWLPFLLFSIVIGIFFVREAR